MINIAIVEDEEKVAKDLKDQLQKYSFEKNTKTEISIFNDPLKFLKEPFDIYDIAFLDIKMPSMNGMNLAKRIRENNSKITIIFVTSLAQFVFDGYTVRAFDFIVKPVSYSKLKMTMERLVSFQSENKKTLTISNRDETRIIQLGDLLYIEILTHKLSFHLKHDILETTGSLNKYSEDLAKSGFSLCNRCFLVNLNHVHSIDGEEVILDNGEKLPISRRKKIPFMNDLTLYFNEDKSIHV